MTQPLGFPILSALCALLALTPQIHFAAGPGAVATVDGRDIPVAVFRMYVANAVDALGLQAETDTQKVAALKSSIVAELIDRLLIEAEARRLGLEPAAEDRKANYQRWRESLGGEPGHRAYLDEHGLSDAQFREALDQGLYGELLRDGLTEGLHIPDSAIADFYRRNREQAGWLRVPASIAASHILIAARPGIIRRELEQRGLEGDALDEALQAELHERRDLAGALRARAVAGEDFSALARQHSDDPGSREAGGDLGVFTRGRHTPAFDDAVFELEPGEIGPVVKSDYGFHVVRVNAFEPGRSMPLRDAAPEIRRRLMAEQQAEVLSEWLRKARAQADIAVHADIAYPPPQADFNSPREAD